MTPNSKREYHPKPSWDEQYEAIVRFKERCDGVFLPTSGHLHEWLEKQKNEAKSLSLSPERVQKMLQLGIELPKIRLSEQLDDESFHEWYDDIFGRNNENEEGRTDEDSANEPKTKKQKKNPNMSLLGKVGNATHYWKTSEAAKIFGFNRGDDILQGIQERVEKLKKANQSIDGWKAVVLNDEKIEEYKDRDITLVKHKSLFLAKAYMLAMEKMNKKTWGECCVEAAAHFAGLGLVNCEGHTIQKWQSAFRAGNVIPHPPRLSKERKKSLGSNQFFDFFPRAKELFFKIANENMEQMSIRFMQKELVTNIIPVLERESRDEGCFDDGSPGQKMLVKLLANPPSISTVRLWINKLGIEYDRVGPRKGRDGQLILSQALKNAWASGRYSNRRPKGQGLKRKTASADDANDEGVTEVEEYSWLQLETQLPLL